MKVPVYEQQQVAPQSVGLPAAESHGVVDAGLQQGLASLDRAGSVVMAKQREAEDKAIVAEVTDKETNLTRGITEDLHGTESVQGESPGAGEPGYLSLQGRDAEANAAGFMDRIEKRRQALADSLNDDRAKKLFLARTGGDVENARRTVESHAAQQRQAADVATLKARMGAAEESIFNAARIGDGATVMQQSIALEGPIKAQALSPEDAARDVGLWQRRTVALQLDGFLDVKRVDVAEKLLEDTKGALGPELTKKYEAAIAREKTAGAAEATAGHIVSQATSSIGEVNQSAVLAELNRLPPDVQAKVRPVVFQRMGEQEQAFAADTKRVSTAAHSLYNKVGWAEFERTPLADELNDRNPALYNQLQNDGQSEADRLARKKRDTKEDRRAQSNIDSIGLNQFLSLSPEDRADADADMWAKGRGMSPVAISSLGKLKEQARQVVERGQATNESEFVKRSVADAESTFDQGSSKEAKDRRRAQVRDHEAKARRWFSTWVSEHEGHAPTDAEAADQSGKLALQRTPIGDEGAEQAAEVIVRRATQKVTVLPEMDFAGGGAPPPAMIRVKNKKTGATGRMPAAKFNPDLYERTDG